MHGGAADAGQRLARQHPPAHGPHHRARSGANPRFPDLVGRNFKAAAPGLLLVADFTYVPLVTGGFAYVAFVIDAFAGTIRGWEGSLSKETAVRAAGDRARPATSSAACGHPVTSRRRSTTATPGRSTPSLRFAQTLLLEGLAGSIGSVGDAYDNALAETTIGLYKAECTRDGSPFRDGPLAQPRRRGEDHRRLGALVQHRPADAPHRAAAPGRGRRRLLGQPRLRPAPPAPSQGRRA